MADHFITLSYRERLTSRSRIVVVVVVVVVVAGV